MKNQQRSKISVKNKYWIPRFRYLELKNFCLQYKDWKLALKEIPLLKSEFEKTSTSLLGDPTELIAIKRLKYEHNIELIEETAALADQTISKWIIKGVTESYSYEYLHYQLDLPVGRDTYYDRYRKFFWLLDQRQ